MLIYGFKKTDATSQIRINHVNKPNVEDQHSAYSSGQFTTV